MNTVNRNDLPYLNISQLAPLIRDRVISPVELAESLLERIQKLDSKLLAFITVEPEQVIAQARAAEQEIGAGFYCGPMHGIPVAHKDVFYTKGLRTTGHSRLLDDFVPDHDATAVAQLKSAGAVTIGKSNTYEFACGGMEAYGFARNPWDLTRTPGGSSSGSAAALAAFMTPAATGTDTGGSIRIPASFCGVVGIKPTYGRISAYGMTPFSWHADHPGPMARTVLDVALMLNAMAGHDPKDSSTITDVVPDYTKGLDKGIRGMRLGVPRQFFFENLHPDVSAAVEQALRTLEDLGATLEEITIPHLDLGTAAHYIAMFSEGASVWEAQLDSQPDKFGKATFHRLSQGRFFTATEYLRAMRVRQLVVQEAIAAMRGFDAIVSPATFTPAYPIKAFVKSQGDVGRLTRLADMTGQPSISVPCGFGAEGMPIGLMITGHAWDEATVLRIAAGYEAATDWHEKRAPITEGPEVVSSAETSAGGAESESAQTDPSLEWMRQFARATGLSIGDVDLEGVLEQFSYLKQAVDRMSDEVDLDGVEFPYTFRTF